MAMLYGQHIENVVVGDNAQAHLGDTIINHYHSASQLPADNYETLLGLLAFDGMDTRARNVAAAFPNTCEWLLRHQDFVAWTNGTRMLEHNGFLWIKGKPGSGKSTIMKETLTWAERTWPGQIILSYFFNARSPNSLEKSRLGLYRALLHQLLCLLPAVRPIFQSSFASKLRTENVEAWTETELENFLVQIIKLSGLPSITVFIDALDEGADDDVRQLVTFIESWTQYAITAGCQLRVCLSSRHYPHITVAKGLTLVVEDQTEHDRDIELYLSRKLVGGSGAETNDLRNRIRDRSAGVFLWVVLVVPILNKAYDQGRSAGTMLRMLNEMPQGLGGFFDQIIFKDTQDLGECVALLQWVLYARSALSPVELYCAVQQTNIRRRDLNAGVVTGDEAIRYIRSCSHGLLELTKSQWPKVQFIHETVRDYLMGCGTSDQSSQSEISAQGFEAHVCHTKLAEDCLRYLLQCRYGSSPHEAVISRYPLADYAARNWWRHLQLISRKFSGTVVQLAMRLLTDSRGSLFTWVKLYDIDDDAPNPHLQVDYLAPPLYYAAIIGRSKLVRALLSIGADPNAEGWHGTALQMASKRGYEKMVQMLIDAGADVNGPSGLSGTALQVASVHGHKKVVQILIDARADLEASNQSYGTALYETSRNGYHRIAKMLISAGADVNGAGGPFGTALQIASERGHERVVQLLLDAGTRRYDRTSALYKASLRGHERIARALLDAGADVHNEGGPSGTALQAACREGFPTIAQMLIDAGADVNSRKGKYGTALEVADKEGHKEVVRILMDAGADPKLKGPRR